MNIKSQKDFASGLMFMVVGAAFAWGATKYSVGTAARMGPGYFPLMLGVLLAVLGMVITFNSLVLERVGDHRIGMWAWKPLSFIIGGNVIFGICLGGIPPIGLKPLGLIVGIYALTFVASMAEAGWKVLNTFILASALAVVSFLAFIKLLNLQFPVWPAYFTA